MIFLWNGLVLPVTILKTFLNQSVAIRIHFTKPLKRLLFVDQVKRKFKQEKKRRKNDTCFGVLWIFFLYIYVCLNKENSHIKSRKIKGFFQLCVCSEVKVDEGSFLRLLFRIFNFNRYNFIEIHTNIPLLYSKLSCLRFNFFPYNDLIRTYTLYILFGAYNV